MQSKNSKGIYETYKPEKDNLIQILNEVQEHFGYIPKYTQEQLAEFLKMPMAEIFGVITFYSRFTLEPKGKYTISVCLGTACFVKFSLDETRCVGACGLAPVFTVNGEVYGKATVQKLDQVLDELEGGNSK